MLVARLYVNHIVIPQFQALLISYQVYKPAFPKYPVVQSVEDLVKKLLQ